MNINNFILDHAHRFEIRFNYMNETKTNKYAHRMILDPIFAFYNLVFICIIY